MNIELIRDMDTGYCTLGRIIVGGKTFFTIERPWVEGTGKGGRKGASCVAPGVYRLTRHDSEMYPKTWALVNPSLDVYHYPWDVPRGHEANTRTAVLLHAANWAYELRGCIAPGKSRMKDSNGRWMITRSRDAMNEIRTLIGPRLEVTLTITNAMPEAA